MYNLQNNFNPQETEFLSGDEPIKIIPNFTLNQKLVFLNGEYGPFQPSIPIEVPLWLALTLRRQEKCQITIPVWLSVEFLQDILKEEKSRKKLSKLHPYFSEISAQLFEHAPNDINDFEKVRTLVEDIWNVRASKIREGIKDITNTTYCLSISDLTVMERELLKPYATSALKNIWLIFNSGKPIKRPNFPNQPETTTNTNTNTNTIEEEPLIEKEQETTKRTLRKFTTEDMETEQN
eukprot:Anaeramoba_flamelloidesa1058480_38.p1 GENE.a1058480_38~~a1058480_38.p1  ORF type:complete len:236 (+),score=55.09 a1058480_38:35-742(+)